MKMIYKKLIKTINNQKGFSLLEMVVAVGLFSVTILAASGIFQLVVNGQRSAVGAQNIQESLRYVFEVMSKELRDAQQDDGVCEYAEDNEVYSAVNGGEGLAFKSKDGECVVYFLEDGRIEASRDGEINYLTPQKILISSLNFTVDASSQPRVTMIISGSIPGKDQDRDEMRIETTVSSRYYK
ncbi:MAG: prepilin-type N-terminal cleavage/methylation domain-containing protein [Patescibacteria group bacterium]|jgi:prepilin-type N-terminal cleavage/methylation domain-containing protein